MAHQPPDQPQPSTPAGEAAPESRHEDPLKLTRVSRTWIALILFTVLLVLLLIFIIENTQDTTISYFGASGQLPLAVAMLLSAVAGVLLMAIAGTWRIFQLRRRIRSAEKRARASRK